MDKTINEILKTNTYNEDFQLAFYKILEKFVNEYDDISQMEVTNKASELFKLINNQ